MMRARLTYVPLEVADQFEDFIIKRDEQILDAVKARTKDYSTLSLLKSIIIKHHSYQDVLKKIALQQSDIYQ